MRDSLWRKLEPIAEVADDQVESFLNSEGAADLRAAIQKAATDLPHGYSMSLDITLNVFDSQRVRSLPLLTTGLCCSKDGEPYVAHGDSTPERYVVDGEVCEVPHDHCPHCWGTWDFKIGHPDDPQAAHPCPNCGYELGEEVKLMLDDDRCPYCEKGKMSLASPTCDKCGLSVDTNLIAWG